MLFASTCILNGFTIILNTNIALIYEGKEMTRTKMNHFYE